MRKIKLKHKFYKSERFKVAAENLGAWDYVDQLKIDLDSDPEAGDVIPHGDGLRKIRMALPGRGKRGGARVIYFQVVGASILFLEMYAKNEMSDLSQDEMHYLKLIRDEMIELYKGKPDEKKPS
jgi:hypothetical protein